MKLRGSATMTVAKQTARTKKSFISRSVRVPGIGGYPRNKLKFLRMFIKLDIVERT